MPKKLVAFRITKENQIVMEIRRDRKRVTVTDWINHALAQTYPPYDPKKDGK